MSEQTQTLPQTKEAVAEGSPRAIQDDIRAEIIVSMRRIMNTTCEPDRKASVSAAKILMKLHGLNH